MHWNVQAEPLFKDKSKFVAMADPLLEGKYPMKGLYQALAVAAMCLQEEASIRPLISDVVVALEHLADPKNDDIDRAEQSAPISSSEVAQETAGEGNKEVLDSTSDQESYSFSSREKELNELDVV